MGVERLQQPCRTKHRTKPPTKCRTNSHLLCQREFDQCRAERHSQLANHERYCGYHYRHGGQFHADVEVHVEDLRQYE